MGTFYDIAQAYTSVLGIWADVIPMNTPCVTRTYKHGEEVGSSNQKRFLKVELPNPLGIILEGRLELYESYVAHGFAAYRPIRIIREGELFGDFSALDRCRGLQGGRRGETWKLCSGYRSLFVTKEVNSDNMHVFQKLSDRDDLDTDIHTHRILDTILNLKTTIVFIDSSFMARRDRLYNELLDYSWPRAKIYRDCLNSFNYVEKIKFTMDAMKVISDLKLLRTIDGHKYTSKGRDPVLLHLFLDAIWDACNRPIRNEPMLTMGINDDIYRSRLAISKDKAKDIAKIEKELKGYQDELLTYNIGFNDILYATDSYEYLEFFFPIDSANYLLASHILFFTQAASTDERYMKRIEGIDKIFGGKRDNTKRPKKCVNPRGFYRDIANNILSSSILPKGYPFNVQCKEIEGLLRSHLFLSFTRIDEKNHEKAASATTLAPISSMAS